MKRSLFLFLVLSIAFVSCKGPKAYYDYNRQTDFSSYQTYAFYKDMKTQMSNFNEGRFKQSLDSILQQKGFRPIKGNPDFKIGFFAKTFQVRGNGTSVGVRFSRIAGRIPLNNIQRYISLTVNFADADTNTLFWQAVVEAPFPRNMMPQQKAEYFFSLAETALKKYPPE